MRLKLKEETQKELAAEIANVALGHLSCSVFQGADGSGVTIYIVDSTDDMIHEIDQLLGLDKIEWNKPEAEHFLGEA